MALSVSTDGGTQDVLWNRQLTNQLSPFFYLFFFFFFFPWSLRFLSAQVCVVCAGRYEWWDLAVLSFVIAKREKEVRWKLKKNCVFFFSLLFRFFFFFNGNLGPTPATWYCNSAKLLLSSWHCLNLLSDLWTLCGKQDVSLLSVLYDSCFLVSSSFTVQTVVINEPEQNSSSERWGKNLSAEMRAKNA